jgi:hypothetical protein
MLPRTPSIRGRSSWTDPETSKALLTNNVNNWLGLHVSMADI